MRHLSVCIALFVCVALHAQKSTIEYTRVYYKNANGVATNILSAEGNMVIIRNKNGDVQSKYATGEWLYYYKSGALERKGELKEGKATGQWTYYYDDATTQKISETINYKDDKAVGTAKSFYRTGELYSTYQFQQGQKTGAYVGYATSGEEIVLGQFKDDIRVGQWIRKDVNGKILQTIDFDRGVANAFHKSGSKKNEIRFFYDGDKSFGLIDCILYYENGNKRLEGKFNEKRAIPQLTTLALKYLEEAASVEEAMEDFMYDVADQKATKDGWVEPKGTWISYWDDGTVATEFNVNTGERIFRSAKKENKYIYKAGNGNYGRGDKFLTEFNIKYYEKTVPAVELHLGQSLDRIGFEMDTELTIIANDGSFVRTGEWEEFYSDGTLASKVSYNPKTNREFGPYTSYYKNGKTRVAGTYDASSRRVDTWRFYYEDGALKEEVPYVNGKITGLVSYFFPNGKRMERGAWVEGKRVGTLELFHPNGQLLGTENYKEGVFTTNGDFFDSTGKPTLQNGTGFRIAYAKNGNISYKGNYINQKRHGINQWFFDNNKLKQESNYENGELQGNSSFYFVTGSIFSKEFYQNGKVNGVVETFHPNGKLLGKAFFRNGIFEKPIEFFDENGSSILSNGSGVQIAYHVNGKVELKCNFLNYCRQGLAQWYHDNGKLRQEAIYKYSEVHKPLGLRWEVVSCYDKTGKKLNCGTLYEGNGIWHSYDDDNKKTTAEYVNGLPKK